MAKSFKASSYVKEDRTSRTINPIQFFKTIGIMLLSIIITTLQPINVQRIDAGNVGLKIDRSKHLVLESGHPSPMSANQGKWFGNKHFSQTNDYLEIKGNVLNYTSPSGERKTLDLTEIRQKSTEVGYVRVKQAAAFGISSPWAYILFFVVVAFGWLLVKKILPKKKVEEPEVQPTKRLEPIQLLLPYSGQLLTTETLVQLLGIDGQANFDSRRMKRARLIKKINQHYLAQTGRVLIIQDKMSDDKRYVTYKIQA